MPAANCPECNGTGWKIVEREELSGASKCNCVDPERAERILAEAGIPPLYSKASFDNFLLRREDSVAQHELTQVYFAVRTYVREYKMAKKPGLLLMGGHGTGKTHLAVAALRAILQKGYEGLFLDYQNLLDRIRKSYSAESNGLDAELYSAAMKSDILLLDDLGSHRNVTDWVEDTVTAIITSRCNENKTLIATTNLIDAAAGYVTYETKGSGEADLKTTLTERIGPRARSRLFEMCHVFKMPAVIGDFRERRQGVS